MSWDVHVLRLDREVAGVHELPGDFVPPSIGLATEVRDAISRAFPGTDWTDPSWGVCDVDEFALEFSLGQDTSVWSLGILVHGSGDPVEPVLRMCVANGWTALDVQTGDFLDPAAPNRCSWSQFNEWRDRVIKG
jgi:hypothetical protein